MHILKIRVLSLELVSSLKQKGLAEWISANPEKDPTELGIKFQFFEGIQRIDKFDDTAIFDPDYEYGKAIAFEQFGLSKGQTIARKQILKLVLNEGSEHQLYDNIEEILSLRLDFLLDQLNQAIKIDPEVSAYAFISDEDYHRNIEYLNFLRDEIRARRFDVEILDLSQINSSFKIDDQIIKVTIQVKDGQFGKMFYPSKESQLVEYNSPGTDFNRLKLKLTVEQVCVLFRIMKDSGLFFDPEVNLTDVNRFIERSFASKRTDKISLSTIQNNTAPGYKFDKPESKGVLLELVNKVREMIQKQ